MEVTGHEVLIVFAELDTNRTTRYTTHVQIVIRAVPFIRTAYETDQYE